MFKQIIATLLMVVLSPLASLGYAYEVSPEISKTIIETLEQTRPDLRFSDIETTPIEGLYRVRVNGSQFLFSNPTGEYVMSGEMLQARPGMFVPVQDIETAQARQNMLSQIAVDDTIVFPAADETKAVVYVFTDVDCGYCRKLHNESLPGLTLGGVEVRYLAYPRAGIGSDSYHKISSAWCADDPQTALTALKNGQTIPSISCENNPVASQYQLGQQVGVTGTPALVLEDGTLLPGYRPADELLTILGIN